MHRAANLSKGEPIKWQNWEVCVALLFLLSTTMVLPSTHLTAVTHYLQNG